MLERLRAGEIDVGMLALPVVPADGLETAALYDEPFTLAIPAAPPRGDATASRVEDLREETLLLLEDGHCLRDQALEVCSRVNVHETQDYRATSLETLRQMVAAGHGVTLLPELAIAAPAGEHRAASRCGPSRSRRPRVRSVRSGASPPRVARRSTAIVATVRRR